MKVVAFVTGFFATQARSERSPPIVEQSSVFPRPVAHNAPMRSTGLSLALFLLTAPHTWSAQHQHDQLGKVAFPTSCSPAVQQEFERGVAMLHSYWFNYAGKTFRSVLERDPSCAIAYWGIALDLLGNTLSAPPSADAARSAWDMLERARAVPARAPRERDWLDAIRTYFRDFDKLPVEARLLAYNKAMRELSERYPDDFEAQVYYALTLQASAPKTDLTYANQFKSAAILEKLYLQNPQHPGITHYLIHAYDFAPLAEKGIPAARRYADIAPAVPHARHMPAHIYSMTGLWEDSIKSNLSALEIQPDYYHAADFTVYAHLQLAQDAKARALIDTALKTPPRGDRPRNVGDDTARAAMPARYVLERGDWAAAAALPVSGSKSPQADSLTRFTRGLGAARRGDAAKARAEIEAMRGLHAALEKSGERYWADRTEEQIFAVSAWVAQHEGAREEAVALMRKAADSEDGSLKHVAMENRLYPLRELLGDLLLEGGQAAAALAEYQHALKQTPNRYRGLYGAARAAEAAGDRQAAADYYGKLIALAKTGDGTRAELQRAQAFLVRP
jgi:tetratricopeptide (TPR) repeat protein